MITFQIIKYSLQKVNKTYPKQHIKRKTEETKGEVITMRMKNNFKTILALLVAVLFIYGAGMYTLVKEVNSFTPIARQTQTEKDGSADSVAPAPHVLTFY